MIRRIRLGLLAAVAVFALGAFASASASAVECPDVPTGGDVALCIEGKEQATNATFSSEKKAATESELRVENGPDLRCAKAVNKGEFDTAETHNLEVSDLYISFTECKAVNNTTTEANCVVHEPIIASGGTKESETLDDGIDGTFAGEETGKITFAPSELTEGKRSFTRVTIKNATGKVCPAGVKVENANVIGEQECELPNSTTEAIEHEINCAFAGSKLKFGATENMAEFKLVETAKLTGANAGKKFSVQKS
jgi:hypothetical protein